MDEAITLQVSGIQSAAADVTEIGLDKQEEKIRRYHGDNFTEVDTALGHIEKNLKQAIVVGPVEAESTFLNLYTMLLGVWCEARLHKLLYEKGAFDDTQREAVYSQKTLEGKWEAALVAALRKKHSLASEVVLDDVALGRTAYLHFEQIKNWLTAHFVPVITRRNKVAHGQWKWPFTNFQDNWSGSASFKICEVTMAAKKSENVLTIRKKVEILRQIATTINNLSVDPGEFDASEFDAQYAAVKKHVDALAAIDYESYKMKAVAAYKQHMKKS